MQRILIYGDSNTWGYHRPGIRLPRGQRWSTILVELLGPDHQIAAHGLPSRTAGNINRYWWFLNGPARFRQILKSKPQPDIVIVALGSNDLKPAYSQSAADIASSLTYYRQITQNLAPNAKLVYLLPSQQSDQHRQTLHQQLIASLRDTAPQLNLIDPGRVGLSDHVHYSVAGHRQVAQIVRRYLAANDL